ncbi:MAG: hypothetical protein H7196_00560 [candidate division SR1 bacterium]|nr:hypothetical protein [candidate division SR1 bacterium]
MLYAQSIIKQETATLPEISRFYAYVSITFFDTYEINENMEASLVAVRKVINTLYPKYQQITDNVIQVFSKTLLPLQINGKEGDTLDGILKWLNSDRPLSIPSEATVNKVGWENIPMNKLDSPTAGTWKHWILKDNINLDFMDQPAEKNGRYDEELKNLKNSIKILTQLQKNTSLFWLDNKAVVGIWQDRLYDEVDNSKMSEIQFAKMQKNLALALADTVIEIWKVKYIYWSPPLRYTNSELANNSFMSTSPRFVSEFAAVGAVASEFLASNLPDQKEVFIQDSKDARDSGKWGGVFLDSDNQSGYVLGQKIANEILPKLN